jgi:hypothetical protein
MHCAQPFDDRVVMLAPSESPTDDDHIRRAHVAERLRGDERCPTGVILDRTSRKRDFAWFTRPPPERPGN